MATRYQFVDDSGETRLAGFLVPEPLPSTGGTFTGPVEIDNSDDDATVAFHVIAGSGETVGIDVQVDPSDSVLRVQGLDNNGAIEVTDDFSTDALLLQDNQIRITSNGTPVWGATTSGMGFRYHSAPSDGAVQPGEVFLWFDQTNGAAKLMIKGKSADGTVVAGEVALT